jgi:hypothetical protein
MMDATTDVWSDGDRRPKAHQRLRTHMDALAQHERGGCAGRPNSLVLCWLDHRLNLDEADQGEPESSWEEVRRAAFTTALACYKLDRLHKR